MQSDFATISLILISFGVCLAGFVGVLIIYIIGVKQGRKEGDRLVRAVQKYAQDHREPLSFRTRLLIGSYLFISLAALGSILLLMVAILSYETGLPFAHNIDPETLGIVSGTVLVATILATLALRLVFGKIFKAQ